MGLEVVRVQTLLRMYLHYYLVQKISLLRMSLVMFSILQYSLIVLLTARRLKPSHISCHYVAMLPLSWAAARVAGATLEYLPHELETQRAGSSGYNKKIEAWIERRFIHSARNVVVVCDPISDWYKEAYGLSNVHVVRNVPEREAVRIRPIPGGGLRERFGIPDSAKVFIYQGLFSAGRGIETLIDTFSTLDPERCHLVLMGYGEGRYQSLIDEAVNRHANIHFQPAVAREWIVSYSASADIGLWISEEASLSYRYALPNKFFEYAHGGLPILVSDNLAYQADLLREGKFGWSTSLADLSDTLKQIGDADLAPLSDNALRYAAAAVWEEDAKVFFEVYRALTSCKDEKNG